MRLGKKLFFELCLKPLLETGVPFQHHLVMDGVCESLCRAYDDAYLLGPGDTSIYEVTLQHHEVGHQDRDDHDGIF